MSRPVLYKRRAIAVTPKEPNPFFHARITFLEDMMRWKATVVCSAVVRDMQSVHFGVRIDYYHHWHQRTVMTSVDERSKSTSQFPRDAMHADRMNV